MLICLFMILTTFAACKETPDAPPAVSDTDPIVEGGTQTPSEGEKPARGWNDLPKTDYSDDPEFIILGREFAKWTTVDLVPKEDANDVLSMACATRNRAVERRHGVELICETLPSSEVHATIATMRLADINEYDLYQISTDYWGPLVLEDYWVNLYDISCIDLKDSWWDVSNIELMTIYDQLYGVFSDATYLDKNATCGVFYNPALLANHEAVTEEELIGYVNDGTWTHAKLIEIASTLANDLNDDGVMSLDDGDIYGITSEWEMVEALYGGANLRFLNFDGETFSSDFYEKRTEITNLWNDIYDITTTTTTTPLSFGTDDRNATSENREWFIRGQNFAHVGPVYHAVNYFRNADIEWGVLPIPKGDTQQTRYYNHIQGSTAALSCVPKNVADPERSMEILQAMACKGEETVYPVYMSDLLPKISKDDATYTMFLRLFDERAYSALQAYEYKGGVRKSVCVLCYTTGGRELLLSTLESFEESFLDLQGRILAYYDSHWSASGSN